MTFTERFKGAMPQREAVPHEFTWNLTDIYKTKEDLEKAIKKTEEEIRAFGDFKGHLGEGPHVFFLAMERLFAVSDLLYDIYSYAFLNKDEDLAKDEAQHLWQRVQGLAMGFGEVTSFFTPELLSLDENTLKSYEEAPGGEIYRHYFDNLLRQKRHVLSEDKEALLASLSLSLEAPENVFDMLTAVDLKFPNVKNDKGESIALSEGTFSLFRQSPVRSVRKEGFETLFDGYMAMKNTLSATLSAEVKKNVALSKIRGYESALESALHGNNVPTHVYETIINTVKANRAPMEDYLKFRKDSLKVDNLYFYDLYAPLSEDAGVTYTYDEGKKLLLEGLKPLGEDYLTVLGDAFNSRWVDVYPNQNKQSGAYSFGAPTCHPYVLMNYVDDLNSVMTLAHEMGHALHSHYSNGHQHPIYKDYSIFCAEVASTTNEVLMSLYLLDTVKDRGVRRAVLTEFVEKIRTVVYRQTLFADFELTIHKKAEQGEPLSADGFNQLFVHLNKEYYGDTLEMEDRYGIEWARIGHFYRKFYVFQYVTGLAAGVYFAKAIYEGNDKVREGYLNFLKSGSSDYSIALLQEAGVDFLTAEPLEKTLALFSDLLQELKDLV